MTGMFLALLAGGALARGGAGPCPGYGVELTIAGSRAPPARVVVRDGSGQVFDVQLADDGQGVDPVAGDGTWCAPLPPICTGPVSLSVEIGGQRRTLVLPVPDEAGDRPRLRATLGPEGLRGVIARGETEAPPDPSSTEPLPEGAAPPPGAPSGEAPQAGSLLPRRDPAPAREAPASSRKGQPQVQDRWTPVPAAGREPGTGVAVDPIPDAATLRRWTRGWSVVLVLAIAGGAWAWVRVRRRRDARLAAAWRARSRRGGPPLSLAPKDLPAALEGPLSTAPLVVIGADPGGLPPDALRLNPGALPAEVQEALMRVEAARRAPAVLLVLAPEDLGAWRGDPLVDLLEVVAGRFKVWVVGGPPGWPRWPPAA